MSVLEPFLILVLLSGCVGVDPCTDYDLMWMEGGRRSSDFNSKDTTTSICDAYLEEDTWYRFEHDAGNRLIEKPVELWYCGTQAPIWLNGTHPTDTAEVIAEVCATYSSSNVCGWNGIVRIQLCNDSGSEYFVYQLAVPPGCALAYCADAASRKQCVPPLVWLPEEFKCGENITTTQAPPTTTTTSPTGPPTSGWGQWGPWSDCSKPCDYGQRLRRRTCGQLPCTGEATSNQLCAQLNCEELPEETDKGIVLILRSSGASEDIMLEVVESQEKIDTILRSNINMICSQDASLCCGFTIKSISSASIEYVTSSDIYAAKGFPKSNSDETVNYKIIAIVNEAVNRATCASDSSRLRARQAQSTDPSYIPFEVMEMAAKNSASGILQETGLAVKDYLDPKAHLDDSKDADTCPDSTCIPLIVIICFIIPVAATALIGCSIFHKKKKSKTEPEFEKKDEFSA